MKNIYVLIKEWEEFAQEIKEGYVHSLFEFDDDINVRNIIQKIIDEKYIPNDVMCDIVNIDNDIKNNVVIYKDVINWWNFCYPLRGTNKLIENVKELIGLMWALKIKDISL